MLFTGAPFYLLFALTAAIYYAAVPERRWIVLLAASLLIYASFVPAYLLVLAFIIVVDYSTGLLIARSSGPWRRAWLIVSFIATLSMLAVFKYFDFLNENLAAIARLIDWNYSYRALELAIPIGLSFHTFQALSYTIEVYRGRYDPERHFGRFALYVMFFPQLAAGPIERPNRLLPQLRRAQPFDAARIADGLKLMAWGLFKKIVVADNLAVIVDRVYSNPRGFTGLPLMLATVSFAIQIYCDFSGYSDLAVGSARVFGIELIRNFDRPYLAASIRDFWRRWHISLSTWFRDYVYIPLGGRQTGRGWWIASILIVFLLSGLWHGAGWTFVAWGLLHGTYLIVGRFTERYRDAMFAALPAAAASFRQTVRVGITFVLVTFAWIFFRANTLADAAYISRHMWSGMADWNATLRPLHGAGLSQMYLAWMAAAAVLVIEAHESFVWDWLAHQSLRRRWAVYYLLVAAILVFGKLGDPEQFIYFQF
jgi:D-alanyl-lipoteichoic acid acyltransferase DltB (MBOAT superfamily)